MKVFLFITLCVFLAACNSGEPDFVGEWESDTYRTTLRISKAGNTSYVLAMKNPGYAPFNKEAVGYYDKQTKSIKYHVQEQNFPYYDYIDREHSIVYIEGENKIFVDDSGNLGKMSRAVK